MPSWKFWLWICFTTTHFGGSFITPRWAGHPNCLELNISWSEPLKKTLGDEEKSSNDEELLVKISPANGHEAEENLAS